LTFDEAFAALKEVVSEREMYIFKLPNTFCISASKSVSKPANTKGVYLLKTPADVDKLFDMFIHSESYEKRKNYDVTGKMQHLDNIIQSKKSIKSSK